MLLKRILAGVLCAVIAAAGIYYGVTFRFFDRPLSAQAQEEFKQSIALPENFTLAAAEDCSESAKNTLQAVKSAVQSGAYALELNVALSVNGVPYLADGPEYITKNSVQLETVFKANAETSYLRYLLNVKNFVSSQKLSSLLEKYDLTRRVILCGFIADTLRANRSAYAQFKSCIDLDTAVNLKNAENCRNLLFRCTNAGAAYLRCSADEVTPELSDALRASAVKLIIDNVHTDYEMYYALSLNPGVVITDRPAELYTLLYQGEYLTPDMENPF